MVQGITNIGMVKLSYEQGFKLFTDFTLISEKIYQTVYRIYNKSHLIESVCLNSLNFKYNKVNLFILKN